MGIEKMANWTWQKKIIIILLILLISFLLNYYLLIRQQLQKIKMATTTIEKTEKQINEHTEKQITEREIVKEIRAAKKQLTNYLPLYNNNAAMDIFMSKIINALNKSNVQLDSLTPQDIPENDNFDINNVEIIAYGNYAQLMQFMRLITDTNQPLSIAEMSLSPIKDQTDKLQLNMTISFYYRTWK